MSKEIVSQLEQLEDLELYVTGCTKTRDQVLAYAQGKHPGCSVYLLNGGMWNSDGSPCVALKAGGKLLSQAPSWSGIYGLGWNGPDDVRFTNDWKGAANFLSCTTLISNGRVADFTYAAAQGGKRGRSAFGLKSGALCLYCSQDGSSDASTPENLAKELLALGWEYAIMLDSGGSSMCSFDGRKINGDGRKVHNWVIAYVKKEEDKPVSEKKKVVLDPGHGNQSNNKSPDGTYSEPEFALDMAERMRAILSRHGVEVTLTRTGADNPTGKADNDDLQYRCDIANAITDLDLFVSLHSNAAGSGWNSARGWEIYTSSTGDTAGRNICAGKIVERVKAAGVTFHGEAHKYNRLYVLRNTTAPAVLIEHGFHDNQEDVALLKSADYRANLAVVECQGILDYLGISYDGQEDAQEVPDGEEEAVDPSMPSPSSWAKQAWEKAVSKGILDGSSPQGNCTREMLATVLDRLGLLD